MLAHVFIINKISLDMKCEFLHIYFLHRGKNPPNFLILKLRPQFIMEVANESNFYLSAKHLKDKGTAKLRGPSPF